MIILSHVIDSNTPTYGNRDTFSVDEVSQIQNGASANSSSWNFSSNHLGTHIDMPKHFYDNGKTLTDYGNEFWYSKKCFLIDIPCKKARLISNRDILDKIPLDVEFLLIRTGYEKYRLKDKYWNDNPGLAPEFAIWLKKNFAKLKFIGFDFISLTSWIYKDEGKEAHRKFLSTSQNHKPICIIEDMSLSVIKSPLKNIIVSPFFVKGGNGSPVTIFANLYD